MKSSDKGQPSTFARPSKCRSPSSFQKVSPNGLRYPPHLVPILTRAENATVQPETQQQSPDDFPDLERNRISSTVYIARAETGYEPEMTSHPAVQQDGNMMYQNTGYTSFGQSVGHYAPYEIPQTQQILVTTRLCGDGLLQPELATEMLGAPHLPSVAGSSNYHQYRNGNDPTSLCNYPSTATMNEVPSPSHTDPAVATQASAMVAKFAKNVPPWKTPYPQKAQPNAHFGTPVANIATTNPLERGMPLPLNSTLYPNALTCGRPIGNHPPLYTANMPSSERTPIRTNWGYAGSDGDYMQTPKNEGNVRQYQSQSIDVDNEASNLCGGVNRKVQDNTIDLSIETYEPTKLKKKGRKKENVSQQEGSSSTIRLQSDEGGPILGNHTTVPNQLGNNDGANKTGFKDPLSQPRRPPIDPPMRPFSSPATTNSPARMRRSRNANSKNRKADIEPTDSSKQAQPSDANVDVPLGGLGKEPREMDTGTSGSRSRNRSNNKRRRPNCATEAEGPTKESDDLCRTEKRRNTGTHSKRRTKKPKKQALTNPPTRTSAKEEALNEDSDEFSEMIRKKKMPTIGSRGIPAQSHGDSPVSHTVGDASQSDDDSFGAVGNELSSDDDDGTLAKTSPRQLRTPRRTVSEAITINDSPEKTRTPRISRSPGTSRASRMLRTPKTTRVSRGVASKSKDILDDSNGELFIHSLEDDADKITKQSAKRKQRGKKTSKASKTPSSPVNLVSPTPPGPERKDVRRSPRNVKGRAPSKQRADDLGTDSSDDDFDDSRLSARTRGKTKRRTAAGDIATRSGPGKERSSRKCGAESEDRSSRVKKRDSDRDSIDEEPKPPCELSNDEDSDVAAEFPSQEQGSQPIDLKVRIVPKRKKTGPKVFLEREFHKLSPDELAIIRVAFIKRYPSPPSNMQAQGRYEAAHGTAMTSGMIQKTWETQLKPWSKRWWDFYLDFNNKVREKKAAKPRSKDPTLKENEVKSWVDEYYQEHGDAKPNVAGTATKTTTSTDMKPQ